MLLNATVHAIGDKEVLLGGRMRRPADLVIAGIGVVPNVELAREAGLPVGNGITVDEYLRTPDQRIFAIGDCAESPSPFAEALARLESVQNAVDQAACVAKAIVGHGAAVCGGAVVLDRSVRYPHADGGLANGIRPGGHARRSETASFRCSTSGKGSCARWIPSIGRQITWRPGS